MGEKKTLQKERKSPSQKKEKKSIVAAKPLSWPYNSGFSCPSLFHNAGYKNAKRRSNMLVESLSGTGGITKTWISSPSSSACRDCIHQTWPRQLVETNISPHHRTSNPTFEEFEYNISSLYGGYFSAIVVTGLSSPAFAFYKRDANVSIYCGWRMGHCRIIEPYSGDDRYMELTNVVGFQGKFYATSRQGSLVLIEDEGDKCNFKITALGRNRVVPYCKVSKHFREYLIACEKEIYVVLLLSRVSINKVDDVEVYRLDTSTLLLEKVDRLKDDAVFFLQDDRCVGISASSLGCSKGSNCVYFTHDRAHDGSWFVYDMKTSCISVTFGPEFDLPTSRKT